VRFGEFEVTRSDVVFADDNGCVFVPADSMDRLLETAYQIWQKERKQADRIKAGETLRQQLKFADYLIKRASDPNHSFREHLRKIGGEIEE
jgi:4-hydroxy-4-methyl-2-oxoglutarate aldolase